MSAAQARDARFVVIGAGPAGLTAAYELAKLGLRPVVLEKERLVGGLARTENYKGFHFDMGGHRFFTKSEEVRKMWHEVLGDQTSSGARACRGSSTTASSSTIRSSRSMRWSASACGRACASCSAT